VQRKALAIFGGLARSYDSVVDWATLFQDRRWKAWVAGHLDARSPGEILDVGCGTLLFEERYGRVGQRFVGVDLSKEMVRVGQEKRLRNVMGVLNGSAETLPFAGGAFWTIVSFYVAKYVEIETFANELARVSKPDALVLVYDFARPTGLLTPFLALYIQGGLRVAGLVLRLAKRRSAFTYSELPRIIEGSRWDGELVAAMESAGFKTVTAERLTSGVIFAYCGRKRESP
jgi:ubiquinone/menaquinone biosynthesis C-methylase UbiE